MLQSRIDVTTADGKMPVDVFVPAGEGPWPAVVFLMDGMGIRPAITAMGERLSRCNYAVFQPDLYYRAGAYGPLEPVKIFASGDVRAAMAPLSSTTNISKGTADTGALLKAIARHPASAGGKVGIVGYCMSGGIALNAAGAYPSRIAAAASFHGGNLATDAETSPHLAAPTIKARVLIAGADEDASYPPEMAARLETALSAAGVDHRCEIYAGARHGWTMSDFPVYDEQAAERHWHELLALLDGTLRS